jgi:hypothetical protein
LYAVLHRNIYGFSYIPLLTTRRQILRHFEAEQKQMAQLSRQNEHATEEMRRELEEIKTKQKEMIDRAVIFERMDNWFRSSNPKELEVSIWQFLNEEDPAGNKPEDFPELVAAAKRLQALRRAEEEKK